MSIKTLRKRIALVAVSALGVGLLSVAPASAAVTAIADDTFYLYTDNEATIGASAGVNLGEKSFGVISSDAGTGTAVAAGAVDAADFAHIKLTAGKVATAVAYSTAELSLNVLGAAGKKASIIVSGGTITGHSGAASVSGSATSAVSAAATAMGVIIKPNVAAGSKVTISAYTGASVSATAPTSGVLAGIFTVTIASASAAGVPDLAESTATIQASLAQGAVATGSAAYDTTTKIANGKRGLVYVELLDTYTSPIATGTLTASATNGALVNVVTNAAKAAGDDYAAAAAFDSASTSADGIYYVYVTQPVANTAGSTVVTMSWQGVPVASKTLNWVGDFTKLTILPDYTAKTFVRSQTDAAPAGALKNVYYSATDAAGNAVDVATYPVVTGATGAFVGATAAAGGNAAGSRALQTASNGFGTTTILTMSADLSGTGTFKLALVNAAGATIVSDAWTGTVSKSTTPYTFKASFDKAVYAPGSIATLTIEPLDSSGNPAAYGSAATGLVIAVNSAGLAVAGTECVAASTYNATGKLVCKYAVKNEVGSYVSSISLTTATAQDPISITTTVASATTSVSNTEVLAAIVKLIASINKQIRALQKSLRR